MLNADDPLAAEYWREDQPHIRKLKPFIPNKPLFRTATATTAQEVQNTMYTKRVKMKRDFAVSKTGLDAYDAKEGEEVDLPNYVADGLVRDEIAEHVEDGPMTLEQRMKQGRVTANEISPEYGDRDHVAAVEAHQAAEAKKGKK